MPAQESGGAPGWPGGLGGVFRTRRGVAVLAGVALGAGLLGGGIGAGATYGVTHDSSTSLVTAGRDAPASTAGSAPQGSVQRVADRVLPSVVSIRMQTPQGRGTGSGVILSSDGHILTNNHVAAPASHGGDIMVTFNNGHKAGAKVVGLDPKTDLAVLKTHGTGDLQPATLGHSSGLQVGQEVVAIGAPLGLSGTVTTGIISAEHRPVSVGGNQQPGADTSTALDAVQTDAAINPGNSGGPLVDRSGHIIGISSAIASSGSPLGGGSGSIGLGFAIPIDQARSIAKQLIDTGSATHAQLGVTVTSVRARQQPGPDGAGIRNVQPGTAAANAGLHPGDVITRVNDRNIDSNNALVAAVRSHRPGEQVSLTYIHNGSNETTTVKLGSDATT